ncbi:MAG TPA: thiamine pyrophosphate-binding protein [Planctomycetota bacterium]|nr:thiamine pyrophosphate-binding protein [Planctomycetota bacterium]
MDGGSRVAQVLKKHGVDHVFTLCGGHIAPILVACKRAGIRVVDVRHEVNAAFAADAYSRLTGVPGVALVTAGPGVTNTITAVKNAQLAQSALVVIGGATATMLRGRGSLQDIDQMALVAPHVKWAARPNRLADVAPAVEKAFKIARSGVPGPVFVEVAVDLLYDEKVVREWYAAKTEKPKKNLSEKALSLYIKGHLAYVFGLPEMPTPEIPLPELSAPDLPGFRHLAQASSPDASASEIRSAAELLGSAKRPVMVLGSQAMLHPARVGELVEAVEKLSVPTYLSGMARGLLGRGHKLQARHKRREALREADVVLLAGVPCDFRLDYGAHVSRCKVIGVNLSGEDLHKNRKPDLGVLADPHRFLRALTQAIPGNPAVAAAREDWAGKLRARDAERDAEIAKMAAVSSGVEDRVNPVAACRAIDRHLDEKSILVGDGGDFVATASYTVSPRGPLTWLDPGVFGTLGVGAGFALGAKLVRPDHDVWLLWGDGAAGFSIQEVDTLVRHEVPVIMVVGNDAGWTQIAREQVVILEDDCGTALTYADYHKVAEGWGAHGIVVSKESELDAKLDEAVRVSRGGKPVLVNLLLGKTDFRQGSISMEPHSPTHQSSITT